MLDGKTTSVRKRHTRAVLAIQSDPPQMSLKEVSRTLFGFAREQVEIKGTIEIEMVFGGGAHAHSVSVTYTVVNAYASYNIIIGRPALNKLSAMVSTVHLCMKYPVGKDVRIVWANQKIAQRYYKDSLRVGPRSTNNSAALVNFLDLDPRH
ncbi:hypothetical protein CR513_22724, partial [Mucuna pruriens]